MASPAARQHDAIPGLKQQAVEFTQAEVSAAIRKFAPKVDILALDERYRALPEAAWKVAIAAHGLPHWPYEVDWRDCNHFAMRFKTDMTEFYRINGVAFIIDYPGEHSFDLILVVEADWSLGVRILEPQSGHEVKFGTKHYELAKGTYAIV